MRDKSFNSLLKINFNGSKSRKPSPKESLKTKYRTLIKSFSGFFLSYSKKASNFWVGAFWVLAVVCCALKTQVFYAFPLFINALIRLSVSLFSKKGRLTQTNKTSRRWNGHDFEEIASKALGNGDLVFLSKNDKLSSDLLVLSTDKSSCVIQVDEIMGGKNMEGKTPIPDLQSLLRPENFPESIRNLQFKASFSFPEDNLEKLTGKLTLKGSPKGEKFSVRNLILKGSVLKSEWALGLAVMCEEDESFNWSQNFTNNEVDKLEWVLVTFCAFSLIFLVFIDTFYYENSTFWESLLYFSVLLTYLVPLPLSVVLSIVQILQTKFLCAKTNLIKYNLGKVENLLVDKSCITNKEETQVECCLVKSNVYSYQTMDFENDCFLENTKLMESCLCQESVPYELERKPIHEINLNDHETLLFFKSVCVLSHANFFDEQYYLNYQDKVIEEFCKQTQVEVYSSETGCCMFAAGKSYSLEVLETSLSPSKTRAIVYDPTENKYYMFFRGPKDHTLGLLYQMNYQPQVEETILIYGWYEIPPEELQELLDRIKDAKLTLFDTLEKTNLVYEQLEAEATYLGAISLKEQVTKSTKETILTLKEAGIKHFLLGFETQENLLGIAYSSGVMSRNYEILRLQNSSDASSLEEELRSLVRWVLFREQHPNLVCQINQAIDPPNTSYREVASLKLHKKIHSHPLVKALLPEKVDFTLKLNSSEFNLVLSGDALETANASKATEFYLGVLLLMSSAIVVSCTSQHQMKVLARIMRKLNSNSNTTSLRKVKGEFVFCESKACGTTLAENYSGLEKLILDYGFKVYHSGIKVTNLYLHLVFSSISLSGLYATESKLNFGILLLNEYLGYGFFITLIGYFGVVCAIEVYFFQKALELQPELYSCWKLERLNLRTLLFRALEGFANALVLYLLMKTTFESSDGSTELISVCSVVSFYGSVLLRSFLSRKSGSDFLVLIEVFFFGVVLLMLYLNYPKVVSEMFSSPVALIAVGVGTALNGIIAKTLNHFSSQKLLDLTSEKKKRLERLADLFWEQPTQQDSDHLSIDTKKLIFKSKTLQRDYEESVEHQNLRKYRLVVAFYYFLCLIFQFWVYLFSKGVTLELLITINSVKAILLTGIYRSRLIRKHPKLVNFVFGVFYIYVTMTMCNSYDEITIVLYQFGPLLFYFGIGPGWVHSTALSLLNLIVVALCSYREISNEEGTWLGILKFDTFYIGFSLICAVVAYQQQLADLKSFALTKKVEEQASKASEILTYLFPKPIAKRLLSGDLSVSQEESSVTVVFCNICDFQEITNFLSPQELTALLDFVFKKLDRLCSLYGAQKIETVGYTFLACVGLYDTEKELKPQLREISHSERAVSLAVAMLNELKEVFWKHSAQVKLKVGVNSGSVISGVVGHYKPQFVLVGDTINTASRMASTITEPNSIQVSSSAFELLDHSQGIEFEKQEIDAKGKGTLDTYLLKNLNPETIQTVIKRFYERTLKSYEEERVERTATPRDNRDFTQKFFDLFKLKYDPQEQKFRVKKLKESEPFYKIEVLIVLFLGVIFTFVAGVDFFIYSQGLGKLIITIVFTVIYGVSSVAFKKVRESTKFAWGVQIFYILILIIFWSLDSDPEVYTIATSFVILNMTHCSLLLCRNIIQSLSFSYLLLVVVEAPTQKLGIFNFTCISILVFLGGVTLYFREGLFSSFINKKSESKKELVQTENLLKKVLPVHVYDELKEEDLNTDIYSKMTILYADIVGFTSWSSDKTPENVLEMLTALFKQFDENCVEHQVYKVHTIGDCYVVLGNSSTTRDPVSECRNVLNFAVDMISAIEKVNLEQGLSLNMRIGIHTGTVIGGISGTDIVRYDIYGEDVFIANKLESSGIPGKVLVSEETKSYLEEFDFEPYLKIEIPEVKRSVSTYIFKS